MRYTKEIFDILSKGGFISQNSISQQRSHLYDAIEDDFNDYQEYFSGIGFLLEGGNGYYYFSRTENRMDLTDKVQRLALWIDRVDFLKTFNNTFASGFTFRKSIILEKFSSDIELREKARNLYKAGRRLGANGVRGTGERTGRHLQGDRCFPLHRRTDRLSHDH